ncbi:hypothetical protein FOZ63_031018, partial [Perkinsus olseni]
MTSTVTARRLGFLPSGTMGMKRRPSRMFWLEEVDEISLLIPFNFTILQRGSHGSCPWMFVCLLAFFQGGRGGSKRSRVSRRLEQVAGGRRSVVIVSDKDAGHLVVEGVVTPSFSTFLVLWAAMPSFPS